MQLRNVPSGSIPWSRQKRSQVAEDSWLYWGSVGMMEKSSKLLHYNRVCIRAISSKVFTQRLGTARANPVTVYIKGVI